MMPVLHRMTIDDNEWLELHRHSGRREADLLSEKWMRIELPYGMWTCADGREVLFNRYYRAIWQREPWAKADIDEWVVFERQRWFYDDSAVPWRDRKTAARLDQVMEDFRTGRKVDVLMIERRGKNGK
jgi:hypothetical protein